MWRKHQMRGKETEHPGGPNCHLEKGLPLIPTIAMCLAPECSGPKCASLGYVPPNRQESPDPLAQQVVSQLAAETAVGGNTLNSFLTPLPFVSIKIEAGPNRFQHLISLRLLASNAPSAYGTAHARGPSLRASATA